MLPETSQPTQQDASSLHFARAALRLFAKNRADCSRFSPKTLWWVTFTLLLYCLQLPQPGFRIVSRTWPRRTRLSLPSCNKLPRPALLPTSQHLLHVS